eukprot:4136973-Prymnesium_polylepis.1
MADDRSSYELLADGPHMLEEGVGASAVAATRDDGVVASSPVIPSASSAVRCAHRATAGAGGPAEVVVRQLVASAGMDTAVSGV